MEEQVFVKSGASWGGDKICITSYFNIYYEYFPASENVDWL